MMGRNFPVILVTLVVAGCLGPQDLDGLDQPSESINHPVHDGGPDLNDVGRDAGQDLSMNDLGTDLGPDDAGDTGFDSGLPDLAIDLSVDSGADDAGSDVSDVGNDIATEDLSQPDQGTPDEGVPDEGTPDEGVPDEGYPDGGCVPQLEICDGLDNDCDGFIDEGDDENPLNRPCYTAEPNTIGVGLCLAGVQECVESEWKICQNQIVPQPEIYDSWDNDCDGQVDEGFECNPVGSEQECYTGSQEALSHPPCQRGHQVCQSRQDGSQYWDSCEDEILPSPEFCNGEDDDCNGVVDDDFNVGDPCSEGQGECRRQGTMECDPDGLNIHCTAVAGDPTAEICDGLDNDCDNVVDNGFNLGDICSVGIGVCERSGHMVCSLGGETTVCDAVSGQSDVEICDGLDNDCDGITDPVELCPCFPGDHQACYTGPVGTVDVGQCVSGTQECQINYTWGLCSNDVVPGAELCDGLDNDCDNVVDNGFNLGDICSVGIGVCERSGTMICSIDGHSIVCSVESGPPLPSEICNGEDDDCNGEIDEALGMTECGVSICRHTVSNCLGGIVQTCNPEEGKQAESCNNLDDDCNGQVDDGLGTITCGVGECRRTVDACQSGQPVACVPGDAVDEVCGDSKDNDCDGQADEGCCEDPDGDNVCSDVDNCPDVSNPGQDDNDGDGRGNACRFAIWAKAGISVDYYDCLGNLVHTGIALGDRYEWVHWGACFAVVPDGMCENGCDSPFGQESCHVLRLAVGQGRYGCEYRTN